MRVELRDGQWAEIRERINHGQDKVIRKAVLKAQSDSEESNEEAIDATTIVVRVFVKDWNVRDPDGHEIPVGDPDAIDRAPDDIIDQLFPLAMQAWTGATRPNPPTPDSSDG